MTSPDHAVLLASSFRRLTGRDLAPPDLSPIALAEHLWNAPFALVSHGTEADPLFNYGNRTALTLFEMSWEEFTALPSRLSAEPVHRDERARLMERVRSQGFIDDYRGVRISKNGRRFLIEAATVWNLLGEDGTLCGQAAMFDRWTFL
jgi:hypothetical protein